MVGFAVMSFPENKWGGLVSQGIGTSMLQMGNIVKNPKNLDRTDPTSAITGPIATCLFHMEMNGAAVSSGMGTVVWLVRSACIQAGSKTFLREPRQLLQQVTGLDCFLYPLSFLQ